MRYSSYVMLLAPFGMVAAFLATLLGGGWKSIGSLATFVLDAVVAQLFMDIVIYGSLLLIFRIPMGAFFRATRQALAIAFTATSSAAALPKALGGMEKFGVRTSPEAITRGQRRLGDSPRQLCNSERHTADLPIAFGDAATAAGSGRHHRHGAYTGQCPRQLSGPRDPRPLGG